MGAHRLTMERKAVPNLGVTELIIILVIVLLLFGAKKLPDIARSIGKSTKEFKRGMNDAGTAGTEDERKTSDAPD